MRNWLWPAIDDIEDAKKAAHAGASSAFLVGGVTGIVTVLHLCGVRFLPDWDAGNFADAVIFLVLGFFIYRFSRIAAVAALLLYVGGQILMMKAVGFRFSVLPILFTLYFVSAIRGTFEYHNFKRHETSEEPKPVPPQVFRAEQEVPKKRPIALISAGLLLLLAAFAGGYYFLTSQKQWPVFPLNSAIPQGTSASVSPALEVQTSDIPVDGESVFRLKDGRTVKGKILRDDEVYYTVETSGGREEIVIKEDIAS